MHHWLAAISYLGWRNLSPHPNSFAHITLAIMSNFKPQLLLRRHIRCIQTKNKKNTYYHWTAPALICCIKIYSKKPHYLLLAPAFICCIKIHFICPFHCLLNQHPHPPSLPLAKQDRSISLTGTSITIPSCLSGHAITPCPTSYLWDHTITPCPTLRLLPTFIIFTWIFHDSSFNLHPLHLDIQWFLHTITSLVVPMGTDLHLCLCIGPRQTLQRFHLSSILARGLWDEWAISV